MTVQLRPLASPDAVLAVDRQRAAFDELLARYDFDDGVVLVQIPQAPPSRVEHRVARNRGYFSYPPQGLLYLAAALREVGVESAIVDLNIEVLKAAQQEGADLDRAWRQALDRTLERFRRPFVGVSFMFDSTYAQLVDICHHVKDSRPELALAVGGVGATADPERLLRECRADLVFSNEGERPLHQFYAYLRGERPLLPENLSFLADGEVATTALTTGGDVELDITDEYAKIDIGSYHRYGALNNFSRMRGTEVPFATILSRRGCRAHCTFCSVRNFNGRSVRVRTPATVVDEMAMLWERHGVRHFEWLDDDLLYDRDNALALFGEIARRLPEATWCANNGLIAAAVTPELLRAMADSRCQGFTVGLESGNEDMLRIIRKPASLDRFARFADMSKSVPDIYYIVNFILGLPGERFGQMLDSLKVGMRARLDWNNFFTFQPLKNTDAYVAYARVAADEEGEETLRDRSTTLNYNPVRAGAFTRFERSDGIATGWDVFDLSPSITPSREQLKEIWFTFNNLANFLRMPALFTDSRPRIVNAIRWLDALQTAYLDNPSITCLIYYLQRRLGEAGPAELGAIKDLAHEKFARLPYWQTRDAEFHWAAMLDGELPPIDPRATAFIERHRLPMDDGSRGSAEAATRAERRPEPAGRN